jgi:hypothetical protein
MPDQRAWDDLHTCPRTRPFWCSHPHCLWCNWDQDRDHEASAMAASLGERPLSDRRHDPRFPDADYVEDRRYVAWLCVECAADPELVRWFAATVRRSYPEAILIRAPGQAGEALLDAS